jgi:hypothetical protein
MTEVRTGLLQAEPLEASKRSDGFASVGQGPPLFCSCYQPQSQEPDVHTPACMHA